jgi:hypothetical protein
MERPVSATVVPGRVAPLLRDAWRRHTAKRAAIAAGVSYETARNWVKGRASASAETLLRMAERDEAMAAALMRRLDAHSATRAAAADALRAAAGAGDVAPATRGVVT